jgi:hypothetical protein
MSFTYQMVIQLSIGYRLSCTSFFYFYTAQQTEDKREKIQALSLAKECYSMKMDLLTNATVVDDAIRFVSQKSKEKLKSSSNDNEEDKEESNELNYAEDRDQLEEDQEEKTGEITITQVFRTPHY